MTQLQPNRPLRKPTVTKRTEITLDSAILDSYAGRYASAAEAFVIAREGAFLTVQLPADWGLPKLRLRPESLLDFFVAELPLRVTFQTDKTGHVTGLPDSPAAGAKGDSGAATRETPVTPSETRRAWDPAFPTVRRTFDHFQRKMRQRAP